MYMYRGREPVARAFNGSVALYGHTCMLVWKGDGVRIETSVIECFISDLDGDTTVQAISPSIFCIEDKKMYHVTDLPLSSGSVCVYMYLASL